jgi:hypothetical protein
VTDSPVDRPAALEVCFVVAPGQNAYFVELAHALNDELLQMGMRTRIDRSGFPPGGADTVYVVVRPSEQRRLTGFDPLTRPDLLARTIFVGAEQPLSEWFAGHLDAARMAGAVFDLNPRTVEAFETHGVPAAPLPLGYTRGWDRLDPARFGDPDADRSIDTLFFGSSTPRRTTTLAACADVLWRLETMLVISDDQRPNTGARANDYVGDARLDLLRRARTILNIHRGEEPGFEWLRVVQAMHCGAVVVSETSTGFAPLVPGTHFLSAEGGSLPAVLEAALGDPDLLGQMRSDADSWLRANPLSRAAAALVDAALGLLDRPVPSAGAAFPEVPVVQAPAFMPRQQSESEDASAMRQALKEIRLDLFDMKRELRRLTDHGGTAPATEVLWRSASYRSSSFPRVSVLTALYQHAEHITGALDSVRRSRYRDIELIVVDDGSTDGSAETVMHYAKQHPELPLLLVRHPINRGLGHARNTALSFARGEIAFILDSDNMVFPTALGALVGALDDDPGAAMAYGVLECFTTRGPSHIVSYLPWEPERFRAGNYIDAMAAVRISELRAAGGFTTDRRLYGWEDYDLWCGLANRGARGVFLPNFLGRYRVSPTSMLVTSNYSHFGAYSAIIERHPQLMEGVQPPR